MERFDKAQQKLESSNGAQEPAPTANGTVKVEATNGDAEPSASPPASTTKRKAESEELSELEDESPAPKKVKKSKPVETDAQIAARLQAELNAGTRATRGGGAKRKPPVKREKKTKKKSSAKVNSDDDSEVESGEPKPEKEKKGGFHVSSHSNSNLPPILTLTPETHEPLRASLSIAGRDPAITTPNCQENLGIRQRARPPESQRQAPDSVR